MRLVKGDKVKAEWLETKPVSLAGVQMKLSGTYKTVSGVVTHIRGDHPINPTSIGVCIMDAENVEHWVDLNHVTKL